jgi:hypothetical protein
VNSRSWFGAGSAMRSLLLPMATTVYVDSPWPVMVSMKAPGRSSAMRAKGAP